MARRAVSRARWPGVIPGWRRARSSRAGGQPPLRRPSRQRPGPQRPARPGRRPAALCWPPPRSRPGPRRPARQAAGCGRGTCPGGAGCGLSVMAVRHHVAASSHASRPSAACAASRAAAAATSSLTPGRPCTAWWARSAGCPQPVARSAANACPGRSALRQGVQDGELGVPSHQHIRPQPARHAVLQPPLRHRAVIGAPLMPGVRRRIAHRITGWPEGGCGRDLPGTG